MWASGSDSYTQVGPNGGGASGVFGAHREATGSGLDYTTYIGYDCYYDDGNNKWYANRTTLGRKWKTNFGGYHQNRFSISTYDGGGTTGSSIASGWLEADWDERFGVDASGNGSFAASATATIFNASNGFRISGTAVIDNGRNLTNIGTISSGAITSSGAVSGTNGAFSGSLALSADSSQLQLGTGNRAQIFHNSAALYLRTSTGGVNVQASTLNHYSADATTLYFSAASGGLSFGGTQFLTSSRAITNCTGISLTGGSISSYGSVTAGLGSFLVGTRGKMGQVSNDLFVCSTTSDHSGLKFANGAIHPTDNTGTASDSAQIDLGSGSYRFSDIYARNSTILTSDRNEKQDIEELSDAEQRVAVRAKGLLRKFKWKDAVAEKGDDARIHFGIVAQDLQAAFVAEGLDAGDYGVFISNTWTNENGHEQTRMGIRYAELLAFIISAI